MSMLDNRNVKRYLKEGIHTVKLISMIEVADPQLIPQADGSSKEVSPFIELCLRDASGASFNHRFWVSKPEDLDKFDIQVGHIKDQTGIPGQTTAEVLQNLINTDTEFKIMIAKNFSEKTNKWYTNCYFNEDTINSASI